MPILRNIGTLVTCRDGEGQGDLQIVEDAAMVWTEGTIRWIGPDADRPDDFAAMQMIDAGGRLVIPGLVDCHSHLCFGGWRAEEFTMRCLGKSYLEIAEHGGGIASTVQATRAASESELVARCKSFLDEIARLGVTTVEAKSGYGLTVDDELKQLHVYRRLREEQSLGIVPTFLGAHIVPPEYEDNRAAYVQLLCEELIPRIARERLADFCDVFLEESAFRLDETRRILTVARKHGLRPKLHADQLSDSEGAALAAELGAASADHLEYASGEGIRAMAAAGTVAVNLPLATLYLDERPMPARRFIEAEVPVAVASDFNPGSAPSYHLPLALLLACTRSHMTPEEALKGATRFAARAIGREHQIGSLEPGKQADFAILNAPSVAHWLYHFRPNATIATFVRGQPVFEREAEDGSLSMT